jgi:hypothetical protein
MVLFFVATDMALEVGFAVGWWVTKKTALGAYYVTSSLAAYIYNKYHGVTDSEYRPQLAITG